MFFPHNRVKVYEGQNFITQESNQEKKSKEYTQEIKEIDQKVNQSQKLKVKRKQKKLQSSNNKEDGFKI